MIHLTYEDTVALLLRAVEEKGEDYVYQPDSGNTCLNFNADREPSCIAGHVYSYAGFVPTLEEVEDPACGISSSAVSDFLDNSQGRLTMDPYAAMLLRRVQLFQDDHNPWGYSVKEAMLHVPKGS